MTFQLELPLENPYGDDDKLTVTVNTSADKIKFESRKYELELGFPEWQTVSGFINHAVKSKTT